MQLKRLLRELVGNFMNAINRSSHLAMMVIWVLYKELENQDTYGWIGNNKICKILGSKKLNLHHILKKLYTINVIERSEEHPKYKLKDDWDRVDSCKILMGTNFSASTKKGEFATDYTDASVSALCCYLKDVTLKEFIETIDMIKRG